MLNLFNLPLENVSEAYSSMHVLLLAVERLKFVKSSESSLSLRLTRPSQVGAVCSG